MVGLLGHDWKQNSVLLITKNSFDNSKKGAVAVTFFLVCYKLYKDKDKDKKTNAALLVGKQEKQRENLS